MDNPTPAFRWLFGGCVLDESRLELRVGSDLVELERKPLEVLRYLLRHAGEVVTKDELQNAVWAGRILSETVLTKAVSRIREVLGDEGTGLIKTVHGYGYRLVAEVRVEAAVTVAVPVLGLKAGDSPPSRPQWALESHLGSGGHGEVWRVLHRKTADARVFKFALQPEALDGLKREITLFRLLRQQLGDAAPVAEILDWNLEEAPYFLEMRHYPQGNLLDWANAGGGLPHQPLQLRLKMFLQLADAVAAVHGVGVLHKDLKPANVLVTPDAQGEPGLLLADFGGGGVLADELIDNAGITRLGFTRRLDSAEQGTVLYLAPEVLEGQPLTLKSDAYALGVMLYQLCIGDFKKPIAPGWEQGIDDALLREDIAAAAEGNPARRIASAAVLAERVRTLDARRRQQEEATRKAELAEQAEAQIKATQLRLDRLKVRRKWTLVTMAVFLAGTVVAALFAWRAEQANARTQAAMQFLLDDVFGGFSLKQGPAKQMTVNSLIERAARRVDERFPASDVAGRAQAYSALWGLYGISDYSTLDAGFNDWLQARMMQATAAWFAQDPARAYSSAYRVVVDIDFWNDDPAAAALTEAVARYAELKPRLPAAQKLHLSARQAEEHLKRGDWRTASSEMQAIAEPLRRSALSLLRQEPFTLFTAINNSSKLGLNALGESLCASMAGEAMKPPLADDTTLKLEYFSACAVSATLRGDSATALVLGREGLALARANYDDMVGFVPTFLRFIGSAELAQGQAKAGFAALDEAAALRRKLDDGLLPYVLVGRGTALERLGGISEALADYREASDALTTSSYPLLAVEAHARLARLLAMRGATADAEAALARIPAQSLEQLPTAHRSRAAWLQAQAALAAAQGDQHLADRELAAADQLLADIGYGSDHDARLEIAAQRSTH
ncbi:MAG: winged helix-turn-helix domain-containing protein [Pseudomonadota bacterium]